MHYPGDGNSPYSPTESISSSSSNSPLYSNGNSPSVPQMVVSSSASHYPTAGNRIMPYLTILNQPQSKFRFRYVSEMTGTHGCLMAESNDRSKKEYIRVQMVGCQEKEAIIRCTLVTNNMTNPVPHVHRLGGDGNPNGTEGDHQDIPVSFAKNDWTATFSGLTIIHTAKKQVRDVVEKRLMAGKKGERLNRNQGQQLKDEADTIANTMDLHSVKLEFQAFVERNGYMEPIGMPEYSQAIHNLKSTHAGDLRIVRIDKVYSCCTGQEEIFIFVEKVNKKDIKIRFFEMDETGDNEVWHAFADFSELDVHHQYAIAFKTPPYQNQNIESNVTVQFQLYRPSNGSTSEAKTFTYIPREHSSVGMKRRHKGFSYTDTLSPNKTMETYPSRTSPRNDAPNFNSSQNYSSFSPGSGEGSQDSTSLSCDPPKWSHQINTDFSKMSSTFTMPVGVSHNQQPFLQKNPFQLPQSTHHHQPLLFEEKVFAHGDLPMMELLGQLDQPCSSVTAISRGTTQHNGQQQIRQHQINHHHHLSFNVTHNQYDPPATVPNVTLSNGSADMDISEVNFDQSSDDIIKLMASLSEMEGYDVDWATDASAGPKEVQPQQPLKKTLIEEKNESKKMWLSSPLRALFSRYSVSMALALRSYAETGDMTQILTRMCHLMALQSEDGDNALHNALFHNQIDALRAMLKAAANLNGKTLQLINSPNNFSVTPLHLSVIRNQTEATALLLQNGADANLVDTKGNTPLHIAAGNKHLIDCVQLLLNSTPLDKQNYDGLTPLLIAVSADNMRCVELLVTAGADVNCRETKRGWSALHFAVKKNDEDMISLLLIKSSLDVNAESYDGSTPLHLAVIDDAIEVCAILMDRGADAKMRTYVGPTSSPSDLEDSDDENIPEQKEELKECRSPLDMADSSSKIYDVLMGSGTSIQQVPNSLGSVETTKTARPSVSDSGIDLELSKSMSSIVLDEEVVAKLSRLLDTQNKEWEKLAESLNLGGLRPVLMKHPKPVAYLLENLDLWEVSTKSMVEKMQELGFSQAAAILEDHLLLP